MSGFVRKGHLPPNTSIARVVNGMRDGLDQQISSLSADVSTLLSAKAPFFAIDAATESSPVSVTCSTAYAAVRTATFDRPDFNGDSAFVVGLVAVELATTGVFTLALCGKDSTEVLCEIPHLEAASAEHRVVALLGVWKPAAGRAFDLGIYAKRTSGTGNLTYSYSGIFVIGGHS